MEIFLSGFSTTSGLALDPLGNIYVTGDPLTIKMTSEGTEIWRINHLGKDIALDSIGNIYVTGSPWSLSAGLGTFKFNSNGEEIWRTNSLGYGETISVDGSGNVYVGYNACMNDCNHLEMHVVKYQQTDNNVPTISGTPSTSITAGSAYTFTPSASDPDGDTLTFSITNKPPWASFSTSTGALTGTAVDGTYGNIQISVNDSHGSSASLPAFSITVTAINRPPTISGVPTSTISQGAYYTFTPTTSDPDGDTFTFSVTSKPYWATFSTTTGALTGTPPAAGTSSNIVISVSDGHGGSALLPAFAITVIAVNNPPTISGTPSTTATAGSTYSFTPIASDPDGNTLTFSITNKPSWASFNTSSGALSGTPESGNIGTTSGIFIYVSDSNGGSASVGPYSITVNAAPSNTVPAGTNVTVAPAPTVALTFNSVTSGGNLTATTLSNPSPPANFRVLTGSSYEITTTAAFNGPITVCMDYSDSALYTGNESRIRLFHNNGQNWEDITLSVDTVNNQVCGVTYSLSPFIIAEPTSPPPSTPETGATKVPVMNGWWIVPGVLSGLLVLRRRRR